MAKILILEDNKLLNKTVSMFLDKSGFETISCFNANDAYDALYEDTIDLILSDIMMPEVDGFEFLEAIRADNSEIPILFMSAKDDFKSKQKGYSLGIDDYLVKPVNLEELELKINAVLRRSKINTSKILKIGNLSLDLDQHTALYDGEEITLTVKEFNILFKLLSYPKKTFTRAKLMEEFWGFDSQSSTRTIDVFITKIRDKFSICSEFEIQTVHGLGYKAVINNDF